MLSFTHTLISLPFAVYLNNPLVIFVSAFIFHLLADSFLHWNIFPDEHKKFPFRAITIDILGGLLAAWLLIGHQIFTWPFIFAIAGGNAPDVFQTIWIVIKPGKYKKYLAWATPFFNFHDRLQVETRDVRKGLISQFILIALATYLIL